MFVNYDRRRAAPGVSHHWPFRKSPPSMAARLADKAPANMDATSQSENVAYDFRATSAATFVAGATVPRR